MLPSCDRAVSAAIPSFGVCADAFRSARVPLGPTLEAQEQLFGEPDCVLHPGFPVADAGHAAIDGFRISGSIIVEADAHGAQLSCLEGVILALGVEVQRKPHPDASASHHLDDVPIQQVDFEYPLKFRTQTAKGLSAPLLGNTYDDVREFHF